MAAPAVSVLLVSWNTRDRLNACLANLRPQVEEVGGETWVVDNDSADGSADMVAASHPWARLVRNDANVGFARACNLAIPQAGGRYLFFFNPDATLDPGGLSAMTALMDAHPDLGALMPRLLNRDGSPTHFVGRAPRLLAAKMRLARALTWKFSQRPAVQRFWQKSVDQYLAHSGEDRDLYERTAMEGAALFVRRADMEAAGLFDPGFFCGWEETDLTLRLRRAGRRLAVTPRASVRHWDQQSRNQWKSRPWEIPDAFYFVRKHKGRLALRLHAAAERRRLRYHAAAGLPVEALQAEQSRCLAALLKSPAHPGYPPEMD
jgi:GT2 family glycosyltransferase